MFSRRDHQLQAVDWDYPKIHKKVNTRWLRSEGPVTKRGRKSMDRLAGLMIYRQPNKEKKGVFKPPSLKAAIYLRAFVCQSQMCKSRTTLSYMLCHYCDLYIGALGNCLVQPTSKAKKSTTAISTPIHTYFSNTKKPNQAIQGNNMRYPIYTCMPSPW